MSSTRRSSRSQSLDLEDQEQEAPPSRGKRRSSSVDRRNADDSANKRSKTEEISTPEKTENEPETDELGNPIFKSCQEAVDYYTEFPPLPTTSTDDPAPSALDPLIDAEREQLEVALGFRDPDSDQWREDWSGNLCYADDEIINPISKAGKKSQSFRQTLFKWAENNTQCQKLLVNLIRYTYNMKRIPPRVKQILAAADLSSVPHMEMVMRRTRLDPEALKEDGWTIVKSEEPSGAIGGPFLIGDMVRWQGSDAVIIAYVHDRDYGDLWKGFWPEDLVSFDLEAEELVGARKKWERRNKKQSKSKGTSDTAKQEPQATESSDFRVKGVDEGIVLAASHNLGARPGVFWPARVMHASESQASNTQSKSKRGIPKNNIYLVFLLPYWNSDGKGWGQLRAEDFLAVESVEANAGTIKEYPFNPSDGIDMAKLDMAYRFTGLPKSFFSRFVNSHRLAMSLKLYARVNLKKSTTAAERATFGLFKTHPLSSIVPVYPPIVLHLPFTYILSNLPEVSRQGASSMEESEGVLNLSAIVESMAPPKCWNESVDSASPSGKDDDTTTEASPGVGADLSRSPTEKKVAKELFVERLEPLLKPYPNLRQLLLYSKNASIRTLSSSVLEAFLTGEDDGAQKLSNENSVDRKFYNWASLKGYGEDLLVPLSKERQVVLEWRRLMERLYRRIKTRRESNEKTLVATDSHCNLHLTKGVFMERSVRLPAALKAARTAANEMGDLISFVHAVDSELVSYVDTKLLRKVHDAAYLRRMKRKCMEAKSDDETLMLTEGSDGAGGHDTTGCKGSWEAALHGVAVAVSAVNAVFRGECSNAFCATRPPGHHAGKKLHAMKAISNGFCLLNPVASVAIHAVTPPAEGGLGLRRVCVIDFDVHHGNGTQDILCSTFDPRFLYISMHAGGIQPVSEEVAKKENSSDSKEEGKDDDGTIFPGRCGDTSPHKGVLNIPMGFKVTSIEVGNALLNKISPAVETFAPDLIVLSAGFDAHKNDPMGLGSLSAEDFGHITGAACQLAYKSCSGRVVSVLEGGYGVPCCRPQRAPLSPPPRSKPTKDENGASANPSAPDGESTEKKDSATMICQEITSQEVFSADDAVAASSKPPQETEEQTRERPQPSRLADLGDYLPEDMDDQVPYKMQRMLEKCNDEGFMECVQSHVSTLAKCSSRHSGR